MFKFHIFIFTLLLFTASSHAEHRHHHHNYHHNDEIAHDTNCQKKPSFSLTTLAIQLAHQNNYIATAAFPLGIGYYVHRWMGTVKWPELPVKSICVGGAAFASWWLAAKLTKTVSSSLMYQFGIKPLEARK